MNKFKFRLDSVLKLRGHQLRMRQRELALALSDLESIEIEIERGRVQAAEAAASYLSRAKEGVQSERLGLHQQGVEETFWIFRRNEKNLAEANVVIDGARGKVAEAHKGVRALELLREKAEEAHRAEELKEEIRELDETAGRGKPLVRRIAEGAAR